ncbi:MAG: acyl-CoA carboxylase subunit epsilon [Rhodoluna sp.]
MSDNEIQQSIKVERGNPTAEELAALIAIVQSVVAEESMLGKKEITKPHSTWSRGAAQLRAPITPGLGQWRAAYRDGLN